MNQPSAAAKSGKCPNCGAPAPPGSNVCGYCGTAIAAVQTTVPFHQEMVVQVSVLQDEETEEAPNTNAVSPGCLLAMIIILMVLVAVVMTFLTTG